MSTFFSNIASNFNSAEYSNCEPLVNNISDPILKSIIKYRNHPSIFTIGEICKKHPRLPFSFSKINRRNPGEILKLETSKACQDTYTRADILLARFNDSVEKSNFPSSLKKANITPVFKKGDRNSKDNYRPVSILPNISKIFERCIFRQSHSFMF